MSLPSSFGVPIWYPLDAQGEPIYEEPLVPDESRLPVDPSSDCPDGFDEAQRGKPGGFAGDPDIMDTWATSSLTPEIASGWCEDNELFPRTYPMDLRPQVQAEADRDADDDGADEQQRPGADAAKVLEGTGVQVGNGQVRLTGPDRRSRQQQQQQGQAPGYLLQSIHDCTTLFLCAPLIDVEAIGGSAAYLIPRTLE